MKGLRLIIYRYNGRMVVKVRIDLIYEGIATDNSAIVICICQAGGPNWPDLWRDCDPSLKFKAVVIIIQVRIDLIYEGIATCRRDCYTGIFP